MKRGLKMARRSNPTINTGRIQPATRVLILPFLLQTYEEVDYILDSMLPDFKRLFAEKGYELLEFSEIGFSRFYTQVPIKSMEDLSRLKMWTWEGEELADAILHDVGIENTIGTSLFAAKEALENGIVDAYFNTFYAQVVLQWYPYAKYMANFNFGYTPCAFLVKKDYYQSLPVELRYTLEQALGLIFRPLREIVRGDEEKAYQEGKRGY